jgi:hypothetical protein
MSRSGDIARMESILKYAKTGSDPEGVVSVMAR